MMIDKASLLERFLRYVHVDTTADPEAKCYPSSEGQWALGHMLVSELQSLGIIDARQDEHGIILATLPGNVAGAPVVVLNSHLDTSPEASALGAAENLVNQLARLSRFGPNSVLSVNCACWLIR